MHTRILRRLLEDLHTTISTAAFNELEHLIYTDMYQQPVSG